MEKTYPVMLGGEAVGTAAVSREGLYLQFVCRCRFRGAVIHEIVVSCGAHTEALGVPSPDHGEFLLQTRRPAKRFAEEELAFRAQPKHSPMKGKFIPLSPEEPFACIHRLQDARLEVRRGQVGLVIPDDGI